MKKIAYALIATLLITNFLTFTPSAEISDEQFTHTVFAEEFTATWCVYCPSAAENLMLVYEDAPGEPCLLYTSPSPRDLSTSRMPSSA